MTEYWPCHSQSDVDIQEYYRGAEVGAQAVVRETQHHWLIYKVTRIEGQNPARGRVYIHNEGAFYTKHGKNCFHPKGKTCLVVPTDAILAWAATHPQGGNAYDLRLFPS